MSEPKKRKSRKRYFKAEHADHVLKQASYVQHQVLMYWRTYNMPMRYRDIMPRMAAKLPKGITLIDFVAFLQEQNYCHIVPVLRGNGRFVFPPLRMVGLDTDTALERVMEHQRVQEEYTKARDRRRKAEERTKLRGSIT